MAVGKSAKLLITRGMSPMWGREQPSLNELRATAAFGEARRGNEDVIVNR
jgi:hypothetical protein